MPISRASLPATPAKIVLTPNAKTHLLAAIVDGDRFILDHDNAKGILAAINELSRPGYIQPTRSIRYGARQAWALTENGLKLRGYYQHQDNLAQLAEQVKTEGISGEDLADLAASVEAEEETGSVFGISQDFQLAFAMAASLADQSAQDLRQDLEQYMGW